ncbi:hypothetical protein FPOAC1_012166 [Fusarium poae]|uniref:hypothetical protein n=1 Tax=Fusarium poae TaxID=36050 RepID=UPI001CE9DCE1|nr:hypothetical protein FPOAC1_012166 [Fusarium poae]KAG8667338.1 hypothetical protein FPOAC1_012166 [Fusarium poae]
MWRSLFMTTDFAFPSVFWRQISVTYVKRRCVFKPGDFVFVFSTRKRQSYQTSRHRSDITAQIERTWISYYDPQWLSFTTDLIYPPPEIPFKRSEVQGNVTSTQ